MQFGDQTFVACSFRPRADFLLVRPQERMASAIIATVLAEKPNVGEIVAVGPGKASDKTGVVAPMATAVGQTVRFGEFSFPHIYIDGQKHLIMREADIAGIVEAE